MAKSNPNIPTVNIVLQDPVTGYVVQGIVEGVPPAGSAYAGIFALDCILQDTNGAGIYQNTGSVAAPAWELLSSDFQTRAIAALGTVQNSTPTPAQLQGGIVTQTGVTGAGTVTLPTGAVMSAATPGVAVGTSFQTVFSNLGGGFNLTLTGATGMTVIGTAAIPSGRVAMLTFVNTGTDTWNCYVNLSA